ncbi:hypothetical protein BLGI_1360 [Brevibacillus laterosporus GI-9]|nr:hypothetical protein BLGI_1360 [Brevibacillus laterosporus GI-9]
MYMPPAFVRLGYVSSSIQTATHMFGMGLHNRVDASSIS